LVVGCKNTDRLIAEDVKLGIIVLLLIGLEKMELDEGGVFNIFALIFKLLIEVVGF
jgi:hypothetical protein